MSRDIANIIQTLLVEREFVTIPALGSFRMKRLSAVVDPVTGKIHPPGGDVVFNPIIYDGNQELKEALVKRMGLDAPDAEKALSDFVREIKKKLERKEIVYLNGIGKLFLSPEDEIAFVSSFNTTKPSFALPDVNFSSVTTQNHRPTASKPAKKSPAVLTHSKIPAVGLTAVIAIALISLAASLYFAVRHNVITARQPTTQVRVNQKPTKLFPSPVPLMDESSNIDGEETNAPTSSNAVPAIEVEEPMDVQETPHRTIANNECVIIAGTFSRKKDAQKMINRLIEMGFAPYKDKKGKRWRIGILFGYESVFDIKERLDLLSDEFQTDAWVLRK